MVRLVFRVVLILGLSTGIAWASGVRVHMEALKPNPEIKLSGSYKQLVLKYGSPVAGLLESEDETAIRLLVHGGSVKFMRTEIKQEIDLTHEQVLSGVYDDWIAIERPEPPPPLFSYNKKDSVFKSLSQITEDFNDKMTNDTRINPAARVKQQLEMKQTIQKVMDEQQARTAESMYEKARESQQHKYGSYEGSGEGY